MVNFTNGVQYIYVLREGAGTGFYKIGRSNNPERRRGELQTGNPRRLHFHCNPKYWQVNDNQASTIEKAALNAVSQVKGFQRIRFPDRQRPNTEWVYSRNLSPCHIVQKYCSKFWLKLHIY